MTNDELIQAINFVKAGNKQDAFGLLSNLVKREPKNELAWLWLSSCVGNNEQKIFCLRKVLEINSKNDNAIIALEKISKPPSPSLSEIITPNNSSRQNIPSKRNGIKTCLLSCLIFSILAGIVTIIVIFIFGHYISQTSSQLKNTLWQIESNAVCQKSNKTFNTGKVQSLGDERYQSEGFVSLSENGNNIEKSYRCIYRLHPEMETEEDRNNPVGGAVYLAFKYGEVESFEEIK